MEPRSSLRNALFFSTARLVVESQCELDGTVKRVEPPQVGTAFIVEMPGRYRHGHYLVTARHLVENAELGTLIFRRKRKSIEDPVLFDFSRHLFRELWYYANDPRIDVAIMPLTAGPVGDAFRHADASITAFPFAEFSRDPYTSPQLRFVRDFEEVLFVGYPLGFWDPTSGSPIVRRGVTATSTQVDYLARPEFLLDENVHAGCSGAPVLVIDRELIVPPDGHNESWGSRIREEERLIFLGMITDVDKRDSDGKPLPLNLGWVLKAREIFRVIEEFESLLLSEPPKRQK